MKVILISGSPRPQGNTALLMQECAKTIESMGVEAEVVSFAGMKIESCVACQQCTKLGKCSLNDGLNEIIDKIRDADGLIVGAPVYFGTARGDVIVRTAAHRLRLTQRQQVSDRQSRRACRRSPAGRTDAYLAGNADVLPDQRHDRPRLQLLEHGF